MKANCPSCGAETVFKSKASVFSVCGYCRSMIVRHDMDLEALGKMAELPDDISPIKIGSRGKYKNSAFEVIGRLKVAWSEGYWNEWCILYDNGKRGWLAEAMGFFMISLEVENTERVPARDSIEVGKGFELAPSKTFYVDDMREAVCIGSEGELPFEGLRGRKTLSVDLSNPAGEFVCIEYSDNEVLLYIGKYVEFGELGWSNLRDLSAEIKKIRQAEVFKCPSCGGPVSMMTPGLTASVVCKYCGSTIDATNESLQVLCKAEKKMKIKPLIPLGSRGALGGGKWEVTGFMRRSDASGLYEWDEYLLFNPFSGFRWLTTYKGHWNFVEMLRTRPVRQYVLTDIDFRKKKFRRFLVGKAKVVYVLGEFYWRVKIGDTVDVSDFIAPPEMLSSESDKSEVVWSLGQYIEPQEVGEAFGVTDRMPGKEGVAPNQVSPYAGTTGRALAYFFSFALALTILQLFFFVTAPVQEVYRGSFTFDDRKASKAIVSPAFEIPRGTDSLKVDLHSPVQNDWLDATIELVDESTNQSLGFEQGVEYYSGWDEDGSWTEGNQHNDMVISSVPGGRYHLVIQPIGPGSSEKSFTVTLKRGIATWCNYVTGLLLLSVYPLFVWWRSRRFETSRWSESDLSPYQSDDDDE